jgi:hypothetical protein
MSEPILDIEALEAMTDPAEVQALEGTLQDLTEDTDILLFVAPGCRACPHQIRSVATVTLASPRIAVEIVDATQEPELATQYEVRSVPTTVVGDELIMVGVIPAPELALRILEQQGPGADRVVFSSLVESGRIDEAAARLSDGRATEIFGELWSKSTLESRMGLFLVAEKALEENPLGLDPLVPILMEGLQGDGPLSQDDTRRGDTADLLGRIGNEDARPVLEALTQDSNPEVAEAAQEALEELD